MPWEGGWRGLDGGVITWVHVAGVTTDVEVIHPGSIQDFVTARQRAGSRHLEWDYEGRKYRLPQSSEVVLLVEIPSDAQEEGKD